MTGSKVNQLRFDISEKVRLHPQQPGIGTLLELDLYPDVEVEDQQTHLKIQGYLRLNGTYQPEQEVSETDESGDETRGEATAQKEEIAYVIPVEITLPAERVDMDQIASEIHSFDYQVLSPFELQIEALLTIDGFIQEEKKEEEEDPVEVVPTQSTTFSVPSNEDIRWKQDLPGDPKSEQDEYEFVHVARLEKEEPEGATVKANDEEEARAEPEEDSVSVEEEERVRSAPVTDEEEEARDEGERQQGEDSQVSPVYFHPYQSERDREEPPLSRQESLRMPHLGEFDFQHLEEDERTRFGIERMFEEKDAAELSSEQPERVDEPEEWDADPSEEEKSKGSNLEWAQWILGEDQENFVKLRMVIVQKEDSIDSLSERYQIPASKIVHLNRLESEVLEEGQIVYLPSN